MIRSYKCIVLFGEEFSQREYLEDAFSNIPFVRIFQTLLPDEIEQILMQAEQTAILLNRQDEISLLQLVSQKNLKAASSKAFFLDEAGVSSEEEVEIMSRKGVSILQNESHESLKRKLSLLLLGTVELMKHEGFDPNTEIIRRSARKSYFSHFRFHNGQWDLVASTHEQDLEIEKRLGKSWSLYCHKLLSRAAEINSLEEDAYFSHEYFGLVYPHIKEDKRYLSIVHIKKDPVTFDTLKAKALQFLRQI